LLLCLGWALRGAQSKVQFLNKHKAAIVSIAEPKAQECLRSLASRMLRDDNMVVHAIRLTESTSPVPSSVRAFQADLHDPHTITKALRDFDLVLIATPSTGSEDDRTKVALSCVRAVRDADVRGVVVLSIAAEGPDTADLRFPYYKDNVWGEKNALVNLETGIPLVIENNPVVTKAYNAAFDNKVAYRTAPVANPVRITEGLIKMGCAEWMAEVIMDFQRVLEPRLRSPAPSPVPSPVAPTMPFPEASAPSVTVVESPVQQQQPPPQPAPQPPQAPSEPSTSSRPSSAAPLLSQGPPPTPSATLSSTTPRSAGAARLFKATSSTEPAVSPTQSSPASATVDEFRPALSLPDRMDLLEMPALVLKLLERQVGYGPTEFAVSMRDPVS
jgi:hypothetical protein